MKRINSSVLVLITLFILTSCGKKDASSVDNSAVVFCVVKRSQKATKCNRTAISSDYSKNEVCQIGLEYNGASSAARGLPSVIKSAVDSGQMILISKESGKRLYFKEVGTTEKFLIIQQEGDSSEFSSVTLPFCPDVGV